MPTWLKVLVGIVGLLLAFLGVRWMFVPAEMAAEVALTLGDPVALNTVRGDLGGMFIAGALLCLLGIRSGEGRWLQALALMIGCIAAGRSVGLVLDGFAVPSVAAIAVELTMVCVLLLAAHRTGGSTV